MKNRQPRVRLRKLGRPWALEFDPFGVDCIADRGFRDCTGKWRNALVVLIGSRRNQLNNIIKHSLNRGKEIGIKLAGFIKKRYQGL
jgi:hypothetical protein